MYQFPGFSKEDFEVFLIPEFHPRMSALRTLVRPKLAMLGDDIAPRLSTLTGHPMYPHTASHARRRVNPPDDTWVAFSRSDRGYKRYAHFEVGITLDEIFVRFSLKPEAEEEKKAFIHYLKEKGPEALQLKDPAGIYWYEDDHGKNPHSLDTLTSDDISTIIRLTTPKSHGFTLGVRLNRAEAVVHSAELATRSYNAISHLGPLYRATFDMQAQNQE